MRVSMGLLIFLIIFNREVNDIFFNVEKDNSPAKFG